MILIRQYSIHKSHSSGFTLLEMLIALSLFALLGVLSNRLLTTSVQIDERLKQQFSEQDTTRQLFSIFHDDLEQIVPRQTRVNGNLQPIFLQDSDKGSVSFVRGGYSNPFLNNGKNSRLIKVTYEVAQHPDREKNDSRYYRDQRQFLLRKITHRLDASDDASGDLDAENVQVIMADVSAFSLLPIFSGGGSAERTLPLLPNSVLVDLSSKQFGTLRHTIMVR
jgi:general secretion pathway protein J